jgi:nucleotide-binding universal stress UspA family protein
MDRRSEPKPWKKVIAYADSREESQIGLAKALLVAGHTDGAVTVFDALDGVPSQLPAQLHDLDVETLARSVYDRRRQELLEAVSTLKPRVPTEIVVKAGVPALELIRHALRTNADLIVKTALGRDIRRLTSFGSTALHLVRKSPIPVWLQNPRTSAIRRVLATVNLGTLRAEQDELNRRIVATARRVAQLEGAELDVLYVVDAARIRLFRGILSSEQFGAYAEAILRGSHEALDRLVAVEAPQATTHLEHGVPKEVIADFVRDRELDLVVMGSVGQGQVAGMLIGDLAEELLCRVDCSVITLKPNGFVTPISV